MRKLFIVTVLASVCLNAFPQLYPFDSIPDNLKKRADAVVRTSQCLYTILEPGKAVSKIKKAVTLLNEDAEIYRYLMVNYDKYSKVNYIRGAVYDEKGIMIKALGITDVFDMSAITGGSFYADDRMKLMRFPANKYPFTIEYEYEISYMSLPLLPSWSFQDAANVSVERSGIQFVFPKEMKIRYLEQSLKNKLDSATLDDKTIYTWQESNIPAASSLPKMAGSLLSRPVLDVAPVDFEYGGYKGSMRSWKTLGEWVYSINKGRDQLPESEITAIKVLTAKYQDQKDKVKAVYEYMQSKTRYVSIQIGVGGYQTAEARDVATNGFGDCKALSNYTMALLREAGIRSYLTLVNAGIEGRDINTGFVDNIFNHVILCVPIEKDTVWLECTSQTLPFNYLGSHTCDRHVLVLTPEGGKLVKTPGFRSNQNITRRSGSFFINTIGTSSARLTSIFTGYNFDLATSIFSLESEDEMKKTLYSSLYYPDFTVTSAKYTEKKTENPSGEFQYQVNINGFGTLAGNRLYFSPSLTREEFLTRDTLFLRIKFPDIAIDSIVYFIPEGYRIESLPGNLSLNNEFGSYSIYSKDLGDRIIYYRRLELKKGFMSPEKYETFREFFNNAARSDREVVILRRKISG